VPPWLDKSQRFSKGANFAITGATALDLSYFQEHNITSVSPFNITSAAPPKQCDGYLGKSLFVMGEIGGNDYVFLLAANKTVSEKRAYVPTVVRAIAGGVEVPTDHNGCLLMLTRPSRSLLVDQCKRARTCRG